MSGNVTLSYDTTKINSMTELMQQKASVIVGRTALRVVRRIKQSMREPKSGRLYIRGQTRKYTGMNSEAARQYHNRGMKWGINRGRKYFVTGYKYHQASAPGESPAVDYGLLVNSIEMAMESELVALVNVVNEAGLFLEIGGAKLEPRPFLAPAVDEERDAFFQEMEKLFL
jgi:hypothetical protein